MTELEKALVARAQQLLEDGTVSRVVGWTKGEFVYDPSPPRLTVRKRCRNLSTMSFAEQTSASISCKKPKSRVKRRCF